MGPSGNRASQDWFGLLCEMMCYTNIQPKRENGPKILVYDWQSSLGKFQDIYLAPRFVHQIGGDRLC